MRPSLVQACTPRPRKVSHKAKDRPTTVSPPPQILISPSNSQSPTQKHMVVTRASDAARRLKQLTSTAVPFNPDPFVFSEAEFEAFERILGEGLQLYAL
jgi:hypothetical protein